MQAIILALALSVGTPLVTCIYDAGHEYNADAPKLTVQFFKEHTRSAK